jgi:hypothetical protein
MDENNKAKATELEKSDGESSSNSATITMPELDPETSENTRNTLKAIRKACGSKSDHDIAKFFTTTLHLNKLLTTENTRKSFNTFNAQGHRKTIRDISEHGF